MLSSACLTNHDTMPGLAPQMETAVVPPGLRAAWPPAASRAARSWSALPGPIDLVEIEAEPGLDDGVDIERADLAAELHDVDRGGVDRQVDAKALAAACGQQRHQHLAIIVAGDAPAG